MMLLLDPLALADPQECLDLTELRDPPDLEVLLDLKDQAHKMEDKDPVVLLDPPDLKD